MDLEKEFAGAYLREVVFKHLGDAEWVQVDITHVECRGSVVVIDTLEFGYHRERRTIDVFEMLVFVWSKLEKKA